MKKLLLVSIFMLLSSVSSFAQADMKMGVALDMDLSLVAQIDRYNIVLGDSGFAVDYLVKTGKFDNKAPLSWYFAGGGWAGRTGRQGRALQHRPDASRWAHTARPSQALPADLRHLSGGPLHGRG